MPARRAFASIAPSRARAGRQCDRPVTDEIESVCFSRLASCDEAAKDFEEAEAKVQDDNNPQAALVGRIMRRSFGVSLACASVRHVDPFPSDDHVRFAQLVLRRGYVIRQINPEV